MEGAKEFFEAMKKHGKKYKYYVPGNYESPCYNNANLTTTMRGRTDCTIFVKGFVVNKENETYAKARNIKIIQKEHFNPSDLDKDFVLDKEKYNKAFDKLKEVDKKSSNYFNSRVAADIISERFLNHGFKSMFTQIKYTDFENEKDKEILRRCIKAMHEIFSDALKELGG